MNSQNIEKSFIVLMALLMSIVAITIDALLPALKLIATEFSVVPVNRVQYVIGYIFIGIAVGQLISGPLSDALGRKKILYTGVLIYFVGSLICYYSSDFNSLLMGRLVQGFGVSGPYVSVVSIVRDKYAGRDMARMMSFIMMIFIMVPAIAPALGESILFFASWHAIFLMYIVYALLIAVWVYLRLEETLPPENRIPFTLKNMIHGVKEVAGNRPTVSYTLCIGICFGSFFGYLNSSQQIFQEQFNTGKLFALYFGLLALVLGLASLSNSRYVQKLGMRYICFKSFQTIIIASAIFISLHPFVEIRLWMFLLYAAFLFFSFGLIFGNLNALAMEPMGHIAGIASAIIGSVSTIISMLIGAAIGQLYNGTLVPVVAGFLVLSIGAILLMQFAHKNPPATAVN